MKKTITLIAIFFTTIAFSQIPNYVPSNGLVGYWPFVGNANDASPNGNNGTVQGATLTIDRFGQSNHAYSFNGDDTIVITNPIMLPIADSSFSTSLWFKDSTWLIRGTLIGWGMGSGIGSEANYIHIKESGGVEHYFWLNDLLDSTTNLSGAWHHVVVTYSKNTHVRIMYLDGDSVASNNAGSVNVSYSNISIGVQQSAPGFFCNSCGFTGAIDDIGIWNRVLTQQEITTLHNATSTTAIDETSKDINTNIYPNPATSQLFIDASGTPVTEINIYNTTGALVNQTKQPQSKSIDISQLANGVYIAEVKTKEGSVKKRWVKM